MIRRDEKESNPAFPERAACCASAVAQYWAVNVALATGKLQSGTMSVSEAELRELEGKAAAREE